MQRLRLLATSLLASACALTAAAQAPPTPPTSSNLTTTFLTTDPQTLSTSQTLATDSRPSVFSMTTSKSGKPNLLKFNTFPNNLNALDLHADSQALGVQVQPQELAQLSPLNPRTPLLEQNNQPCAKLRVYSFTSQDLKSPHPHSSTETDCTPASSAHLKALQLPATVNIK